jgi:hypothetical protein
MGLGWCMNRFQSGKNSESIGQKIECSPINMFFGGKDEDLSSRKLVHRYGHHGLLTSFCVFAGL